MPDLPSSPTVTAIYEHYKNRPDVRRAYLGGSRIGEECKRMLWLDFRWAGRADFPGRILRLFETGHREEERVLDNLRAIGVQVEGGQHEVVDVEGHVQGHLDAVLLGLKEAPKTWHVADVKTMNKRNFDKLLKEGLEKSKPVYYAQLQFYGYHIGVTRWAIIVQCKDDDRIYIERGEIKKVFAKELIRKARSIVYSDTAPERLGKDPSFWKCKWCDKKDICWQQKFPDVNCRTCVHSAPNKEGGWDCGRGLPMCESCDEHLYLPALLHWLKPIDGTETHIEYEGFVNAAATGLAGKDKPHYSSLDLYAETVST